MSDEIKSRYREAISRSKRPPEYTEAKLAALAESFKNAPSMRNRADALRVFYMERILKLLEGELKV